MGFLLLLLFFLLWCGCYCGKLLISPNGGLGSTVKHAAILAAVRGADVAVAVDVAVVAAVAAVAASTAHRTC